MQDIKTFAMQVQRMRMAQALYFLTIAKAKKTKLPKDFAEAAHALKISKLLESQVDFSIGEITLEKKKM